MFTVFHFFNHFTPTPMYTVFSCSCESERERDSTHTHTEYTQVLAYAKYELYHFVYPCPLLYTGLVNQPTIRSLSFVSYLIRLKIGLNSEYKNTLLILLELTSKNG